MRRWPQERWINFAGSERGMVKVDRADPYQDVREQIDRIDGELLALLNERARAGLEVGRRKRANNDPIYVPEREQAVLDRLAQENPGPLSADAVQAIFRTIIERIRGLEEADGHP